MPRVILPLIVLLFCAGVLRADDKPLAAARALLLTGKYDEASDAYLALAKQHPVPAAIVIAQSQRATGQRDAAEKTLRAAIAKAAKQADLHAELAILLFERGELKAAEAAAREAIKHDDAHLAARWLTAELHTARGELKEAQAAYAWLIEFAKDEAAVKTSEDWLYVGRAAAEYARWTRNSGQFKVLVSDTFPAALELDKGFWPAHLETAALFAEKYNEGEATSALNAALAINPNAAELHALRAALALQKFDVKTAGSALARAKAINPELLAVHHLQADLLLADQRAADALNALEQAQKLNPVHEETLGRLAACYLVLDGPASADDPASRVAKLTAEVEARNPHCGRYYCTIADAFDLLRKYPQASRYYDLAFERMPQLVYVRGRNGLVKMRLGEEVEAAKLLDASFQEDPFNVRVKNMLAVLDVLQGYAVLETEHFILRFDRGHDELLAKYAAKYLEEDVYPQIVKTLGYKPEGKSLFEIFNRAKNTRGHSWFSARMVGLPFIGTVGACGGKIVAVASPNDMPQKFHWGRVLKHEFVHVVNLQQTDFNIPHWFTEGIAVRLEEMPRPTSWNEILAKRAAADDLFDLSNINYGFIRPQNQDDWTLAYCQAELYCDYAVKTYGDDALAKLLAAYRENLSTEAALAREFGVKTADFEKGYRAFVDAELKAAGHRGAKEHEKELSLAELEEAIEKTPADAGLQAKLAFAHLNNGGVPAARKAALAARKLDHQQPLAAYVLARIQVAIGDTEAARELLVVVHDDKKPDERVIGLLAAMKLQAEDFAGAESLYLLGRRHFAPRDKWLKALAKLYLQSKEEEKLAGALEELAGIEYDSATLRKKLAQLAIAREDWPAAERWAKDAMFIDLADPQLHAQLAEACANRKRWPAAIEEYRVAIELDAEQPAWRLALADALVSAGQKAEAKAVLEELLELSPKFPGADVMLEQLKQ